MTDKERERERERERDEESKRGKKEEEEDAGKCAVSIHSAAETEAMVDDVKSAQITCEYKRLFSCR